MSPAPRRRAGFTLMEMAAVTVLTAMVLMGAINLHLQLAEATTTAADATRVQRRAVLLLDRIARDLEGATLLVRPDEVDPLAWPWLFLAEAELRGDAADRIKLDTRTALASAEDAPRDLAVVAWWTESGTDDVQHLYRWSASELPESLDRRFPGPDDADARLVAEDVVHFGVRLLDDEGAWHEAWDSSTLTWSNALPVAAEVAVALAPHDPDEPLSQATVHRRVVRIPVRPLDLQALREGEEETDDEEEDEEQDGECVTVAECRQRNPQAFEAFLSSRADRAAAEAVLQSLADQCYADHAGALGVAVEGCE